MTPASMTSKLLGQYAKLKFGFSNVIDGNMAKGKIESDEVVLNNRRLFLQRLGQEYDAFAVIPLGMTDNIEVVNAGERGQTSAKAKNVPLADAAMTADAGVGLMILTADCTPAIAYDPVRQVCGLIHMSWECTHKELARKFVERMVIEFKTNPNDILVYFGLGIKQSSYLQLNPSQRDDPRWQPYLRDLTSGETAVDIPGFNRAQLIQAGVLPDHIEECQADTRHDKRFFSCYRTSHDGGGDGRFATGVMMGATT